MLHLDVNCECVWIGLQLALCTRLALFMAYITLLPIAMVPTHM